MLQDCVFGQIVHGSRPVVSAARIITRRPHSEVAEASVFEHELLAIGGKEPGALAFLDLTDLCHNHLGSLRSRAEACRLSRRNRADELELRAPCKHGVY